MQNIFWKTSKNQILHAMQAPFCKQDILEVSSCAIKIVLNADKLIDNIIRLFSDQNLITATHITYLYILSIKTHNQVSYSSP